MSWEQSEEVPYGDSTYDVSYRPLVDRSAHGNRFEKRSSELQGTRSRHGKAKPGAVKAAHCRQASKRTWRG